MVGVGQVYGGGGTGPMAGAGQGPWRVRGRAHGRGGAGLWWGRGRSMVGGGAGPMVGAGQVYGGGRGRAHGGGGAGPMGVESGGWVEALPCVLRSGSCSPCLRQGAGGSGMGLSHTVPCWPKSRLWSSLGLLSL